MNDDPLLRTLAAADTPPPPGVGLSPAALQARAAARTRRAVVLTAGIALFLAPLGTWLAQHLASASQDDDRRAWTAAPTDVVLDELADELRALGAQLARLRATLASPAPPIAAVAVTPAARLNVRTALAEARAAALSDHRPVETRR